MIKIISWLWLQPGCRTKYTMDHVALWAEMVRRNCTLDYRLACVTNLPNLPAGVERINPPGDFEDITPAQRWAGRRPNCYRRLSLFRRDAAEVFGSNRIVSMDLDCIIGRNIDPLFDRPDDLVLFKGTAIDRPYNGSMLLIKAGCRPNVFEEFTQDAAIKSGEKFVGSDQAYLAQALGWKEKTWSEHDGVYWYGRNYKEFVKGRVSPSKGFRKPRIVFFPGKLKPDLIAQMRTDKFITDNYRIMEREAA